MKRVTSINFKGVSRLPQEKSAPVLQALDNIATCIVETYDALEDPKLGPAEKQQQLVSFTNLGRELDCLSQYASDEYGACDSNYQSQVGPLKSSIQSTCSNLKSSFNSFNPNDQNGLKQSFDSLLKILEDVIEMFKSSERNTVFNICEMVNSMQEIIRDLSKSSRPQDIDVDIENSRAVGGVLFPGVRDRAAVLKEEDVKQDLISLASRANQRTDALVSAARNNDSTRGSLSQEIDGILRDITDKLNSTKDQCFISFEVDYTDDPVVVALQKLSASALRDRSQTGGLKEDALQKISQRIAQSRSNLDAFDPSRALEMKNACDALEKLMPFLEKDADSVISKDYQSQREAFIQAYNELNSTIQKIKEQVLLLPVDALETFSESTALLDAASGFLKGLDALSLALPDN